VNNPAYCQFGHCLIIAESPCPQEYATGKKKLECADEEIAAIRSVLQRLTTVRIINPTDAEDLVQETLLTLLTRYPEELEKGLLVWSLGILRKKVGNYYRKVQRFTYFSEQETSMQQTSRKFITETSPESGLFHDELQRLVNQVLAQFPAAQRKAIELLIAGFNSGEIAEQLIPERYQNVINHIHRGRKKLAKELAKYGYGPNAKDGMHGMKRCRVRK
jgi:RNA polymerase sigma factor (sigma-70 family)